MKEYRTRELYGNFYEKPGRPFVVVIGGSRPGLPAPLDERFLNYLKENFNVLLLAYFGVGALPGSLERVPIEYFVNAVSSIKKEYGIENSQVIVIGQSKGGEAALLLTNYMKSVVTIALVPSCYVFQGLPSEFTPERFSDAKSSWTYQNKELPYIKFCFTPEIALDVMRKKYCRCYELSIEKNYNDKACINVDQYPGKILLLSEPDDIYWPSRKMCGMLVKNSPDNSRIQHICLELEGHYLMNYKQSVDAIIEYLDSNFL